MWRKGSYVFTSFAETSGSNNDYLYTSLYVCEIIKDRIIMKAYALSIFRAGCLLSNKSLRGRYDSTAWIMRRSWWVIGSTRSPERLCYVWNRNPKNVRLPWFVSIERFHMTSRRPYWCSKQWNGGHVGAPNQFSGSWTPFLSYANAFFCSKNLHRFWSREWKHSIVRTLLFTLRQRVAEKPIPRGVSLR